MPIHGIKSANILELSFDIRINDDETVASVGDLHSNPCYWIYVLAAEGIIDVEKNNFRTKYKAFAQTYYEYYKQIPEGDLDRQIDYHKKYGEDKITFEPLLNEFDQLIELMVLRKETKQGADLFGDILADRGLHDGMIYRLLKKLSSLGIETKTIIMSNHDLKAIRRYEQYHMSGQHTDDIHTSQSISDNTLLWSFQNKEISRREIQDIINVYYKPNLKLINYAINDKDNTFEINTHAPYDLDDIKELAEKFGVPYVNKPSNELAKTIDQINTKWSDYVMKNKVNELLYPGLKYDDPLFRIIWGRYSDRHRHKNKPFNFDSKILYDELKFNVIFIHGHDRRKNQDDYPYVIPETVINLDGDFGKGDYTKKDYKVRTSKSSKQQQHKLSDDGTYLYNVNLLINFCKENTTFFLLSESLRKINNDFLFKKSISFDEFKKRISQKIVDNEPLIAELKKHVPLEDIVQDIKKNYMHLKPKIKKTHFFSYIERLQKIPLSALNINTFEPLLKKIIEALLDNEFRASAENIEEIKGYIDKYCILAFAKALKKTDEGHQVLALLLEIRNCLNNPESFVQEKSIQENVVDINQLSASPNDLATSNTSAITINDLYANAQYFIWALHKEGFIDLSSYDYEQFKNQYQKLCSQIDIDIDIITDLAEDICNKIKIKPNAHNKVIRFLNNATNSVGAHDHLIHSIINKLYDEKVNPHILFSKDVVNTLSVLNNKRYLYRRDYIEKQSIFKCVNQSWLDLKKDDFRYGESIRLISYSKEGKNLSIYTSDDFNLMNLKNIALKFNVQYQDNTIHDVINTIDLINAQFIKTYTKFSFKELEEILSLLKPETNCPQYVRQPTYTIQFFSAKQSELNDEDSLYSIPLGKYDPFTSPHHGISGEYSVRQSKGSQLSLLEQFNALKQRWHNAARSFLLLDKYNITKDGFYDLDQAFSNLDAPKSHNEIPNYLKKAYSKFRDNAHFFGNMPDLYINKLKTLIKELSTFFEENRITEYYYSFSKSVINDSLTEVVEDLTKAIKTISNTGFDEEKIPCVKNLEKASNLVIKNLNNFDIVNLHQANESLKASLESLGKIMGLESFQHYYDFVTEQLDSLLATAAFLQENKIQDQYDQIIKNYKLRQFLFDNKEDLTLAQIKAALALSKVGIHDQYMEIIDHRRFTTFLEKDKTDDQIKIASLLRRAEIDKRYDEKRDEAIEAILIKLYESIADFIERRKQISSKNLPLMAKNFKAILKPFLSDPSESCLGLLRILLSVSESEYCSEEDLLSVLAVVEKISSRKPERLNSIYKIAFSLYQSNIDFKTVSEIIRSKHIDRLEAKLDSVKQLLTHNRLDTLKAIHLLLKQGDESVLLQLWQSYSEKTTNEQIRMNRLHLILQDRGIKECSQTMEARLIAIAKYPGNLDLNAIGDLLAALNAFNPSIDFNADVWNTLIYHSEGEKKLIFRGNLERFKKQLDAISELKPTQIKNDFLIYYLAEENEREFSNDIVALSSFKKLGLGEDLLKSLINQKPEPLDPYDSKEWFDNISLLINEVYGDFEKVPANIQQNVQHFLTDNINNKKKLARSDNFIVTFLQCNNKEHIREIIEDYFSKINQYLLLDNKFVMSLQYFNAIDKNLWQLKYIKEIMVASNYLFDELQILENNSKFIPIDTNLNTIQDLIDYYNENKAKIDAEALIKMKTQEAEQKQLEEQRPTAPQAQEQQAIPLKSNNDANIDVSRGFKKLNKDTVTALIEIKALEETQRKEMEEQQRQKNDLCNPVRPGPSVFPPAQNDEQWHVATKKKPRYKPVPETIPYRGPVEKSPVIIKKADFNGIRTPEQKSHFFARPVDESPLLLKVSQQASSTTEPPKFVSSMERSDDVSMNAYESNRFNILPPKVHGGMDREIAAYRPPVPEDLSTVSTKQPPIAVELEKKANHQNLIAPRTGPSLGGHSLGLFSRENRVNPKINDAILLIAEKLIRLEYLVNHMDNANLTACFNELTNIKNSLSDWRSPCDINYSSVREIKQKMQWIEECLEPISVSYSAYEAVKAILNYIGYIITWLVTFGQYPIDKQTTFQKEREFKEESSLFLNEIDALLLELEGESNRVPSH